MATQLKKTVMPSGGDYTSLEAALNGNEQNLVTADKYFDVEIDGSWSSADTSAVTIHNYTTDATRYINIYTTSGARHAGKASTTKYRIDGGAGTVINIASNNVRLTGVEVYSWTGDYNGVYINASNCILDKLLVHNGGNYAGIASNVGQSGMVIKNCIVYSCPGQGMYLIGSSGAYSMNAMNCTVYGCGTGIHSKSGYPAIRNCICYNNTTDFNNEGVAGEDTNNLSKDATAPAYGTYYINKTLTFVNVSSGTEDFHLVSTDTDAIDKGVDLSGTFTDDIDGTTRPTGAGTWDIGADEYVSSVTNATITPSAIPIRFIVSSVTIDVGSQSATITATSIKASFVAPAVTAEATKNTTIIATAIQVSVVAPSVSVSTGGNASVTVSAIKSTFVANSATVEATKNAVAVATAAAVRFLANSVTVSTTTNTAVSVTSVSVKFVAGVATVQAIRNVTIDATSAYARFLVNSATIVIGGTESGITEVILLSSLVSKRLHEKSRISKRLNEVSRIDKTLLLDSPIH